MDGLHLKQQFLHDAVHWYVVNKEIVVGFIIRLSKFIPFYIVHNNNNAFPLFLNNRPQSLLYPFSLSLSRNRRISDCKSVSSSTLNEVEETMSDEIVACTIVICFLYPICFISIIADILFLSVFLLIFYVYNPFWRFLLSVYRF